MTERVGDGESGREGREVGKVANNKDGKETMRGKNLLIKIKVIQKNMPTNFSIR